MAYVDRYDAALGIFLSRKLRGVHTNIRGKVVGVNYNVPSVDVQPTAYTEYPSGTVDRYPVLHDIPVHLPSGSNGKARLTMPIKVGDFVGVSFSERNEHDNTDLTTHDMFTGWAVTQIFTDNNSKPIDPDNVVLENDKSVVTLTPEGDTVINNDKVSLSVSPDGTIKGSNEGGYFNLSPDGQFICNGARITKSGRVITHDGVDLDEFHKKYTTHIHSGVHPGIGVCLPPLEI